MCPAWSSRLAFIAPLVLAACPNEGPPGTGEDSQSETAPMTTTGTPDTTTSVTCEIGMLGCPCTGGGACDPGLVCTAEKVCQSAQDLTTGSDTSVDPTMTAGTSTTTDSEGGQTSTTDDTEPPGPECTPTGDKLESAECLAKDPNRPFCEVDTCVGCGALKADACTDATDGGRPICLDDGRCVQCDTSDAVVQGQCEADKPHCNLETNTCEGCFEHSECPQTACEIAARKCFPANQKIYVRQGPTPGSPCSTKPGMGGTMELPYCDFETATLGVQQNGFSSGYTFHLMGNDDAPGDPGAVVITGGDAKVAYAFTHDFGGLVDKHTRFKGIGPLILVPKNVTLYLVNWGLLIDKPQGDTSRGIDCQEGGSVWLDDSRVLYARGPGIRGTGCDIHLRRTAVSLGATEAIDMTGGSLHAVNSFIAGNANIVGKGGGGLHLRDGATVDVVYSTIADNSNEPSQMPGQFGDSIHCDNAASVKIRNSIIVRKPANNNFSIVCPEGQVSVDWSVV
ncbi:MAG TPA: right-handed parallel beta-helix repeat-containing protein, partial [Nannocystis sp.]